jgi:hypothetical protein
MLPQDEYFLLKDYRLNELPAVLERGRRHALLREAGLSRRHWFSCQVCRSLWRLGHTLVTTGQWLERRYANAALNPA